MDRPELKDQPFVPATHPRFSEGETPKSVFATLRDGDVLVHHPYESFATSVQRFIEQAAADPNVLAIKQTLYRTSGDSPDRRRADRRGRGRQAGRRCWSRSRPASTSRPTSAGPGRWSGPAATSSTGWSGLKTHCKTALVVRQEGGVIRRYCHIGTGNYNPKTARIYEDLGLLTADPDVGADLTDLFNVLTGYSRQTEYRTLLVAPHGVRHGIIDRIDREIEHAAGAGPARVRFKMNSLVDEEVIDALYRASRGRGAGRPVHPGHLRAAAGRAGAEREHPGALDRRPVPGALADLLVRQRRRAGVLDRQRPT